MRSLILVIFLYIIFDTCDPNADESGKVWSLRSFNYNMYWLLLNSYSEKFGFGA